MFKGIMLAGMAFFMSAAQPLQAASSIETTRPGTFFNVSAFVDTLTLTTLTPDWTYPKAGIQILTPGYKVSQMTPTSAGFYLFSVSDTVPAKITLTGAPGAVDIKLCLNASGSGVSCEVKTVTLTPQRYAYTASGYNNVVYKCRGNVNGTLDRCEPSPVTGAPDWTPESITFATFGETDYAYVASWPDGIVYRCSLTAERALDICTALTPAGAEVYHHASGVSFASVNGTRYAYVADDVEQVFQCALNMDGTFSTCRPATASLPPVWVPSSTTFATVNGVQYAYVASGNGEIYQCGLTGEGLFSPCVVTMPGAGVSEWLPKSVTFATFGGTQFAYVADDGGEVFQCRLTANGRFDACLATPVAGTPDWSPRTVSFETFGGVQYAYVTDFGTATALFGDVYQCTLNAEGRFTSCEPTPAFEIPHWGNLWWTAFH